VFGILLICSARLRFDEQQIELQFRHDEAAYTWRGPQNAQ
jgi:hypothetical protein